jgi:hypothetical protein
MPAGRLGGVSAEAQKVSQPANFFDIRAASRALRANEIASQISASAQPTSCQSMSCGRSSPIFQKAERGLHSDRRRRKIQEQAMQIRDRELNEETWPRRTPGPPKYRFIDPKVKLAIVRSQMTKEVAEDEVIEDLGDPVNDLED